MQPITNTTFGPLIAYLVPGLTVLAGASELSPALHQWFLASPDNAPTVGGFLYLTIASLAAGMTVSAIRWAVVDRIHAWTGLAAPRLNFANLGNKVEALSLLIRIHYEHYQHYANMSVAAAIAYGCYRLGSQPLAAVGWVDVGFVALEVVFLAASRDTLRRYYVRSRELLGEHR